MTDYKDTLNLPETGFEMRAGLAQKEPLQLARWRDDTIYARILAARAKQPLFVLHDGPPYANGHLHNGHILNKVLKDIVVKDRSMSGHRVPYVPGWDCHGLPIEVQVDKELGAKKAALSKVEIRRACRAYAERFVKIQSDEFERLGIFGRFDNPYMTMSFAYEAQTLRELAKIVAAGLVYKGLRPVNWCATHQTALAEAEVEYEDHASPSIYVAMALQSLPSKLKGPADLVIWTTTPWTLPANLAIAVHATLDYLAYPVRGRTRIVARGLIEAFLAAIGESKFDEKAVLGRYKGAELVGLSYRHPFLEREGRVFAGEHVTLEAGTGCVHIAPGHGAEDFELGRKHGLEVLSPVDGRGALTAEAGVCVGQKVFDANPEIVKLLVDKGALLNKPGETVTHRYAHCWRCHKPIITRATEQWWVAIDKPFSGGASLRERALAALKQVEWIPAWGEDRIRGMLATRPDWCLSRQRTWGVPIAVAYCQSCNMPVLDAERINRVAGIFEQEGADAWFAHSIEELMGPLRCAACGKDTFRKEEDILDVWFDSGVSYAAVIEREGLGHESGPAVDLYLEGSDQHRGWFHSSLLSGLATRQRPPFRAVLTHGFVVDAEGKKESKSKGNYVDPWKAIATNGAELLRLWVGAEDYREDIRISAEILTRLADTYRKLRNTLRYLLGNLHGFLPERDLVGAKDLLEVDAYALGVSVTAVERMRAAYRAYDFHVVVTTMNELCTIELSAFYLDLLKDRLYASRVDSKERRSAQTVLFMIARDLVRVLAPILCFTAEEAWGHLPHLAGDPKSVHMALHPGVDEPAAVAELRAAAAKQAPALAERYAFAREWRKLVNAELEAARRDKLIGSSVEAAVTLSVPADEQARLESFGGAALADLFIVSHVELAVAQSGERRVKVSRAAGTKCPRCWLYRTEVGSAPQHPALCRRCTEALA